MNISNRKLRLFVIILMTVAVLGFAYSKRVEWFYQQEVVFDPWR